MKRWLRSNMSTILSDLHSDLIELNVLEFRIATFTIGEGEIHVGRLQLNERPAAASIRGEHGGWQTGLRAIWLGVR